MKLVKQETNKDCGYACIAMILNISLMEAKKLLKCEIVSSHHIKTLLEKYNYKVEVVFKLKGKELEIPDFGILNVKFLQNCGHWVVKDYNNILCPHFGKMKYKDYFSNQAKEKKVTSILKINFLRSRAVVSSGVS